MIETKFAVYQMTILIKMAASLEEKFVVVVVPLEQTDV